MRVFVDTNVLMDVLAGRLPFLEDSERIWTLAETGRIRAFVAAISFPNCFYILHRHSGYPAARKTLRILRHIFEPVDFTDRILRKSIDSDLRDFEDAVQYHSAIQSKAEFLVTRNPDHFPRGFLPVLTPREFLSLLP